MSVVVFLIEWRLLRPSYPQPIERVDISNSVSSGTAVTWGKVSADRVSSIISNHVRNNFSMKLTHFIFRGPSRILRAVKDPVYAVLSGGFHCNDMPLLF